MKIWKSQFTTYHSCLAWGPSLFRVIRARGGGGTWENVIRGGSAPRSSPLPFYIPFSQKRYPFYIPFIEKKVLLSHTHFWKSCYHFHVVLDKIIKGPFKDLIDRFPYPFIYLKPEKGTPFGRSVPIKAIIGSTPPPHPARGDQGILGGKYTSHYELARVTRVTREVSHHPLRSSSMLLNRENFMVVLKVLSFFFTTYLTSFVAVLSGFVRMEDCKLIIVFPSFFRWIISLFCHKRAGELWWRAISVR